MERETGDEGLDRGRGLFREEALAERRDGWLGPVLLAPRPSQVVYSSLAALLVGGVVALAVFGEHTQKARLSGTLVPTGGLVEVRAPEAGVLVRRDVEEGSVVSEGGELAVLSIDRQSANVGATQGAVVRILTSRREALAAERERLSALFSAQGAAREARLAAMATEADDLAAERDIQERRLALAEAELTRSRDLTERGMTRAADLAAAEEEALTRALELQALRRQAAELARTRIEIEAEAAEAPFAEALRRSEIDRAIAELDQELAEAEAARQIVLTAPVGGTVTVVGATLGSHVGAAEPLMEIIPDGSILEAQLQAPSRSIGLIRPGQRVLLRYDAYPYQRFGLSEGTVRTVSRTTVAPAEEGGLPVEPHYRIAVALADQEVTADGAASPLQAGMAVEADVLIETRPILGWVLDPLRSALGRRAGGAGNGAENGAGNGAEEGA